MRQLCLNTVLRFACCMCAGVMIPTSIRALNGPFLLIVRIPCALTTDTETLVYFRNIEGFCLQIHITTIVALWVKLCHANSVWSNFPHL